MRERRAYLVWYETSNSLCRFMYRFSLIVLSKTEVVLESHREYIANCRFLSRRICVLGFPFPPRGRAATLRRRGRRRRRRNCPRQHRRRRSRRAVKLRVEAVAGLPRPSHHVGGAAGNGEGTSSDDDRCKRIVLVSDTLATTRSTFHPSRTTPPT